MHAVILATGLLCLGPQTGRSSLITTLASVAIAPAANDGLTTLVEKLRHVESFSAEYSATVGGRDEGGLRLVYEAPGKAMYELRAATHGMSVWILDGTMVMRIRAPDGAQETAECSLVDLFAQDHDTSFARLSRSLFPESPLASAWSPGGPWFSFEVYVGSSNKTRLHIQLAYLAGSLRPVLGWLEGAEQWPGTRHETEHSVDFDFGDGGSAVLSKETGFIERLASHNERGEDLLLKLSKLEMNSPIDASEFEIPAAAADAHDISDDMAKAWSVNRLGQLKVLAFSAAVESAATESGWNDDLGERLGQVLEAYHELALGVPYGEWIRTSTSSIDEFAEWLRAQYSLTEDAHVREELKSATRDWKSGLEGSISASLDGYLQSLSPGWSREPEATAKAACIRIDRESATKAFDQLARSPLIKHFDERVAAVTPGD